jgi:hypothetical protein
MTSLVLSIVSLSVAAIALLINYFTFRRQRTLDNENRYFQYKLDIYQQLCTESAEVVETYSSLLNELKSKQIEWLKSEPDYLNQLADRFDEAPEKLRSLLIQYGMFLPGQTVEEIERFTDHFYVETELIKADSIDSIEEVIAITDQYLNLVIDNWEKFVSFLRTDLGIDHLNHSLSKRLFVNHTRK